MRKASILYKDEEAGILIQHDDGSFSFKYHAGWVADSQKPGISPALPKSDQAFRADFLFPFFYHMLPEGSNKEVACRHNRIDPDDDFGLLMHTARHDTIGAVRVIKIDNE